MGTFIRTCLGLLSLWLGIGSPALSATIAKTAAIVAITGENTTTTYGNVTALHALVTGSNPGGLVTFKEGSKVLGTGNLDENNTAHLVKRLDIGTHSITAAYSGDAYNTANTSPVATVTINKALSAFNWSFGSYYPAVGVALPITIAIVGFDATPPTGTLSLVICKASCALPGADIPVGTATLVNGSAAFSYTPTVAGDVYFIATYSGDARNLANSGAYPQRFPAKATPSVAAYPDTKTLGRNEPVNVLTKVFGANATGGVQLTETVNGVKTTLATCALVSGSCTSKISFSTAGTHLVVQPGRVKATGFAPHAARSLRFTASAFQPTSAGVKRPSKWTQSFFSPRQLPVRPSFKPKRSASASMRTWSSSMNSPPPSAMSPCEKLRTVCTRPPTRSRASKTVTCQPACCNSKAAANPASPAPMIMTLRCFICSP